MSFYFNPDSAPLCNLFCYKCPAYRRQSISRPMQTASLEKNILLWTLKFWNTYLVEKTWKFRQIFNRDKTAWIKYLTHVHFFSSFWQKFSNLRPLLSITFPQGFRKSKKFTHWTVERSEKHKYQKNPAQYGKIHPKTNFFLRNKFTPFIFKSFQTWHHFFLLLFPKDSESLKILDIKLQEVGTKKHLNGASKVNRRTGTQTDAQTDGHFDL